MNDTALEPVARRVLLATAIAGTLDIIAATLLTLRADRAVSGMLRGVASGPFPAATGWGTGGALLGLATHYVLMAIMATVFILTAARRPALKASPILWGVLYGLLTYVIMNLIVVPLRFGTPLPPSTAAIVSQLFCHVVLVGIPIALVARQHRI